MILQVDDGIAVDHLGALRPQHKAEPQQHLRLRQCNAEHLAGLFHLGAALYVLVRKGCCEAAIRGQSGLYFLRCDARLASFGAAAQQQQAQDHWQDFSHALAPLPHAMPPRAGICRRKKAPRLEKPGGDFGLSLRRFKQAVA